MTEPDAPVEVVQTTWQPADLAGQRLALVALLFGQHDQHDGGDQAA